eukprot:CAMPEP_0174718362 /NCGR_PEP_ID=MMETSP1094-20130205/28718_1 /TAXON_ID=156173 /ORGANISM="Chrysochromulina brevifilum, Strain UTEX LB 985" /LENGTH=64 /DNA_ID=CAMNT_0015918445 /DNA_START=125 /DNA_END=315 /DNA_ORIENTATION=+
MRPRRSSDRDQMRELVRPVQWCCSFPPIATAHAEPQPWRPLESQNQASPLVPLTQAGRAPHKSA